MSCTAVIRRWPVSCAFRALGLERRAVGVHDFEIADDAGAITVGGQFRGATRVGHGAVLRSACVAR